MCSSYITTIKRVDCMLAMKRVLCSLYEFVNKGNRWSTNFILRNKLTKSIDTVEMEYQLLILILIFITDIPFPQYHQAMPVYKCLGPVTNNIHKIVMWEALLRSPVSAVSNIMAQAYSMPCFRICYRDKVLRHLEMSLFVNIFLLSETILQLFL